MTTTRPRSDARSRVPALVSCSFALGSLGNHVGAVSNVDAVASGRGPEEMCVTHPVPPLLGIH
jgi:hypothetical protein